MRAWCLLATLVGACQPSYPRDASYPLDALRWKGTHNSYHLATDGASSELAYSHEPLDVQLESQGVRQFELDIYYDGARFLVMHLPYFDARSSCATLDACLAIIATWSAAHPTHAPIVIMVELKDGGDRVPLDAYFSLLDQTITRALGAERLITPALVQGGAASIAEALASTGWPTLEETRGKTLVYLLADDPFTRAYTEGGLLERPAFVQSGPGLPYSAITNCDAPDDPRIDDALAAHMLVRTRPDEAGESTDRAARQQRALQSGAHILATDFPTSLPWPADAIVACHPTRAPAACLAADLEAP